MMNPMDVLNKTKRGRKENCILQTPHWRGATELTAWLRLVRSDLPGFLYTEGFGFMGDQRPWGTLYFKMCHHNVEAPKYKGGYILFMLPFSL